MGGWVGGWMGTCVHFLPSMLHALQPRLSPDPPEEEWDFQKDIDCELALRATAAQEMEATSHASPLQDHYTAAHTEVRTLILNRDNSVHLYDCTISHISITII